MNFDSESPKAALPKVAVIDDNVVNLTLIRQVLVRDGKCDPVTFSSPKDGLAYCLDSVPDLVLVDYMMPTMTGIELIEHLRRNDNTREVPVLMITANNQRDIRHAALDSGATDFLIKPIDNKELASRVNNMLKLRAGTKREANRAQTLAEEVARATKEIRLREQELVLRVSRAAEFRDPETGGHIQRMAHYAFLIAKTLGMSDSAQQLILVAAPMHDVGKIATPDEILLKPGKLTNAEFEIMKKHAKNGYLLLHDSSAEVLRVGAEIAWTHHEKFDGTGYPRNLSGEAIPIFGRIIAVADVFDALTTARPYKQPWSVDDARKYIRDERGSHFDPRCVDAFLLVWQDVLEIMDRYRDEECRPT